MALKIFDAFPTPKFLDIPYAGLSISDSFVRIIQLSKKRKKYKIEKYAEKPIPPGVVTSGQINNIDELVKVLDAAKTELKLNYVKVSLPEERGYLFTAKIQEGSEVEIKKAIEARMEENVPVPPGELIFDYKLKPSKDPVKDARLEAIVSTLPITVAENYVDAILKSGLALLSLEIESQSVARAILPSDSTGTVLIVNFAENKVGLYIITDGLVHFTSTIPLKADASHGTDFLAQEIKKLFVYWHTLKGNIDQPEKKIIEIVVCGDKFDDSIVPYLSTHIQTKVMLGNVWTNIFDLNTNVPEIPFSDSLKFASSIGLALHSDILI
jgi:Tfp pilus assembly PilM family ATPase